MTPACALVLVSVGVSRSLARALTVVMCLRLRLQLLCADLSQWDIISMMQYLISGNYQDHDTSQTIHTHTRHTQGTQHHNRWHTWKHTTAVTRKNGMLPEMTCHFVVVVLPHVLVVLLVLVGTVVVVVVVIAFCSPCVVQCVRQKPQNQERFANSTTKTWRTTGNRKQENTVKDRTEQLKGSGNTSQDNK